MAVIYTEAKVALVQIASELATEATSAGQTALATALTNLSTEISGQSVTEAEFFGGQQSETIDGVVTLVTKYSAADVWAGILNAAADVVQAKSNNTQAAQQTIIADETSTIDDHLNRLQSVVEDVNTLDDDAFVAGPHVRGINANWDSNDMYGPSAIARAMMVLNLKATNTLDDVKSEVQNPTPIP